MTLDVYQTRSIDNLDILRNKTLRFGTPRGSEIPISMLTGIPTDKLIGGEADNLLLMLKGGRIDAFLGARSPTMASIDRLHIQGLWYRKFVMKSGGFGVRKAPAGKKLKEKLDALLSQLDPTYLEEFLAYNKLPESGPVILRSQMPDFVKLPD